MWRLHDCLQKLTISSQSELTSSGAMPCKERIRTYRKMWTTLKNLLNQSGTTHYSHGPLGSKKFNNVELLSLAEKLEMLRKSVLSIMSSTAHVLQEGQPLLEVWNQLAQATLARLVMFKKRKGGEASRMLVESYVNRPHWSQVTNPEIMSTLSDFERQLSKRYER